MHVRPNERMALSAAVLPGRQRSFPSSIAGVTDARGFAVLEMGAIDSYWLLTARVWGCRARLRCPFLRLAGAPKVRPEESVVPVALAGELKRGVMRLAAASAGRSARAQMPLGPEKAWTLLYPYGYGPGPSTATLTALWMAALLMPVGFWCGHISGRFASGRLTSHAALGYALAITGVSLVVAPRIGGFPALSTAAWIGALAGLALAWLAGTALSPRRGPAVQQESR